MRPFILAPLLRIALRSRQGVHSGFPDVASLPGLLLGLPQHVDLFQGRDGGSEGQSDITSDSSGTSGPVNTWLHSTKEGQ